MSVQTEADKQRDLAIDSVMVAVKCLSMIVVDQCDGSHDYNEAYKLKHKSALSILINLRDELAD